MMVHSMQERMRVAILLPFCEINMSPEKKIYSHILADFLLDTEAKTGCLDLAEREMNGISTVVFKDEK